VLRVSVTRKRGGRERIKWSSTRKPTEVGGGHKREITISVEAQMHLECFELKKGFIKNLCPRSKKRKANVQARDARKLSPDQDELT